jgi:hypothetical protein
MNRSTFAHLARPAILALLVAAVLLLGAGPSAWATPAQAPTGQSVPTATPGGPTIPEVTPPPSAGPGAIQQLVGPGLAARLVTSAAMVTLPANAMSAPGTAEVAPVAADRLPPANDGYALLGKAIEITLFDMNGHPVDQPSFANPIQVCLAYSADDLAKAGGQVGNMIVQFYDTSTRKWVALPTAPDATGGMACAATNQLGVVALAARSATPDVLPQTGLASPTPDGLAQASLSSSEPGTLAQTGLAALEQATQLRNARIWWVIVVLLATLGIIVVLMFRLWQRRRAKT